MANQFSKKVQDLIEQRKEHHAKKKKQRVNQKSVVRVTKSKAAVSRQASQMRKEIATYKEIIKRLTWQNRQRLKKRIIWDAVDHGWIYVRLVAAAPSMMPDSFPGKLSTLPFILVMIWSSYHDMFEMKKLKIALDLSGDDAIVLYKIAHELKELGLMNAEKIAGNVKYFLTQDGVEIAKKMIDFLQPQLETLAATPYLVGTTRTRKEKP